MRRGLALVAVILVACGGNGGSGATRAPAPREVTGVITEIGRADGRIASFVLRAGEREYDVEIDAARDYGFDVEHLEEHRTSGDPVLVRTEARDGASVALSVDDA